MKIWNRIKSFLGIPTEATVFKDFAKFDGDPLVVGTPGPRLGDLVSGEYFAIEGKENYPKVKLDGIAYYDLSFQLLHNSPNPEWKTVLYSRNQVREIFIKKGIPVDSIDTLLEQRRTVDHDGQI